jgi:hypothetical protein
MRRSWLCAWSVLAIAWSCGFLGVVGSSTSAAPKIPELFRFAGALCGNDGISKQRFSESSVSCASSSIVLKLQLENRADLLAIANRRAQDQVYSCVFTLQRTSTVRPGESSDADYVGVGSRFAFRGLNGKVGDALVLKIQVAMPDRASESKGAASLARLRNVVKEFDQGARAFFVSDNNLWPIDC